MFDRPIGQNQAIQHPLAERWMYLESAWLMAMRAAELYDADQPCGPEANSAKFLGARMYMHKLHLRPRNIKQRIALRCQFAHAPADENSAAALDGDPDTFWSAPPGSHQAVLEADFAAPVTFNRALTMEWLNDGQHVQQYAIEVWRDGAWKAVSGGYAIGHKKIDAFAPVTASRVRLHIVSSASEAHIREFQLFNVTGTP